jgi:3-oxoacyl-[acyl-carrier protein] reductase
MSTKTVIVTGASSGIGFAIARAYLQRGDNVVANARTLDRLQAAAAQLGQPAHLLLVPGDIAAPDTARRLVDAAIERFGQVDILVNNAGVARGMPFQSISDADWQADFDLKVFAHIRLCRLALPGMRARKWGRIINVLAIAAKAQPANSAPSSVSRAAGMALTKALAGEVAADGVLVNALLTGFVESDQWLRRFPDPENLDKWRAQAGRGIPVGRVGKAEEFANLALFLASDAGGYINGTAINVDGGLSPVV